MNKNKGEFQLGHDHLRAVSSELQGRNELPQGARTVCVQNDAALRKAFAEHGLTHIGKAAGHDHVWAGRLRDGDTKASIAEFMAILDHCGLKLVSSGPDMVTIDRDRFNAIMEIFNLGARSLNNEFPRGRGND